MTSFFDQYKISSADVMNVLSWGRIGLWTLVVGDAGELSFDCDDECLRAFGYKRGELPIDWESVVRVFIHPNEQPHALLAMQDILSSTSPFYGEQMRFWLKLPGEKTHGKWIWGEICGQPNSWNPDGSVRQVLGYLRSVHDKKTTLELLQQEQERTHAVLDAARLGTWDWDVREGVVIYSDVWFQLIGYKPGELKPTFDTWKSLIHPDDLEIFQQAIAAHRRNPKTADGTEYRYSYEAEFRLRHNDGHFIWVRDRGRAIAFDSDGHATRFVGILEDITRRKEMELENARQKTHLNLLINAAQLSTWDWDVLANHLAYNSTFLEMLGYDSYELVGEFNEWASLVHPEDRARASSLLEAYLKGNTSGYACDLRIRHKDGYYIWVSDVGQIVERAEDGSPTRLIGGQLNIDERVRMQEHLAQHNQTLHQQQNERFNLIAMIQERVRRIIHSADDGTMDIAFLKSILEKSPQVSSEELMTNQAWKDCAEEMISSLDLITDKMLWYRGVIDSLPLHITVVDTDDCWTYLNKHATEFLETDLESLMGKSCSDWRDACSHSQVICQTPGQHDLEFYYTPKQRYFRGTAAPLYNHHRQLIGYVEAVWDVTELHTFEERQRLMFDFSPLAVLYWNEQSEVIDCNQTALAMFCVPSKQEYCQRFFELSVVYQEKHAGPSRDLILQYVTQAFQSGFVRFDWDCLRLTGEVFKGEITLVRVDREDSSEVIGYVQDVSELKNSQNELEKAAEEAICLSHRAEEASRAKSAFLATMSHEIRTPLNGVIGLSDLLLCTQLDPRQREYADLIRTSGQSLLHLINDILDFSKIEAGKQEIDVHEFDMHELIESVVGILASRAHEKGLELCSVWEPKLSPLAMGDNGRIRQILINLTSNAVKFTESGGVRLQVQFDKDATQKRHDKKTVVRFEILDTGIGMSQTQQERLFMAFSQGDSSMARRFGGTGLGLAISKMLASLMGGDIVVHSQENVGSLFTLILPLECLAANKNTKKIYYDSLAHYHIAILNGNDLMRETLETQLRLWKLNVNSFHHRVEALDALSHAERKNQPFDVVIVDEVFDGTSGVNFISEWMEQSKNQKSKFVLLMPMSHMAENSPQALQVAVELANVRMLSKPIYSSMLFNTLSSLLIDNEESQDDAGITTGSFSAVHREVRKNSAASNNSLRILIAEDNKINQIVVREILTQAGFIWEIAENGIEAVNAFSTASYDLILMDCQMPNMDGFTATKTIRQKEAEWEKSKAPYQPRRHRIPIIALTANATTEDARNCIEAGMDGFCSKPVSAVHLIQLINTWLKKA